MAIAQLSPSSVLGNPAHINPHAQTDQRVTPVQANQTADTAVTKSRTDTVTISQQALMMSAKLNDSNQYANQDAQAGETYEKPGDRR